MGRIKLTNRLFEFTRIMLDSNKYFKPNITDIANAYSMDNKFKHALQKFWSENKHKFKVEIKITLKDEEDYKALTAYFNLQNERKHIEPSDS